MNIDCQWIQNNLEAFFCDRLTAEENSLALRHIESCETCVNTVNEIPSIDPLIKKLLKQELAVARAPRRLRWSVPVGIAATALASIAAVVVIRTPQRQIVAPSVIASAPAPTSIASTAPEAPGVPKVSTPVAQDRAKPQPVAPDSVATPALPAASPSKGSETSNSNDAVPDFLVADPAGYSRTLRDYRGYTLIFGVWSGKQPKTVSNMERLYQTFGPNTKLRILGVANQHQPKPAIATFPIVYNQGSNLLGAKETEFMIVDNQGTVRARGSLLQDPNAVVALIRSELSKIKP